MTGRSLGTSQNSKGDGLTPLYHQKIINALIASDGIFNGLTCTGTTSMAYKISAGTFALTDPTAQTRIGFLNDTTVSTKAGDPANPRIDTIWVKMDEPSRDNDSVDVHCGVVQGVPSSSPVAPAAPAHSLTIAKMLVPAGATNTSRCVNQLSKPVALLYGSSMGKLGEYWWKQDMRGDPTTKRYFYEMPVTFTVPTRRQIELRFQVCLSSTGGPNDRTEWAICFQMDGHDLDHSGANFVSYQSWETHETSYVTTVEAGTHTARIRSWLQWGVAPYFHYYGNSAGDTNNEDLWIGRRFQVFDKGVSL